MCVYIIDRLYRKGVVDRNGTGVYTSRSLALVFPSPLPSHHLRFWVRVSQHFACACHISLAHMIGSEGLKRGAPHFSPTIKKLLFSAKVLLQLLLVPECSSGCFKG